MSSWIVVGIFLALAAAIAFGSLFGAWLLRVRARNPVEPIRGSTYECGEEPDGLAWVRFHPRYYVVALLFVLFDVEAAFLLPWALNLEELGVLALIDMAIFLGILLLGWLYALRKGALKWQ
jgi:NADH-quinone oxidoreductase subunit A